MKTLLLLLLMLIGYFALSAQDSTLINIKASNKVRDLLMPADIFYFPQFTNGKVFFRDGSRR